MTSSLELGAQLQASWKGNFISMTWKHVVVLESHFKLIIQMIQSTTHKPFNSLSFNVANDVDGTL